MAHSILDTGVRLVRNVDRYNFGSGALSSLVDLLGARRKSSSSGGSEKVVFVIDSFFQENNQVLKRLNIASSDTVIFLGTESEPSTSVIDNFMSELRNEHLITPCAVVGIGGGIALDTAKAISNLFTNGGSAENYQGWDLLKNPGIYKIGIPTISGTGSEATRTCVMTNPRNGLKLGMNSDYTVFNHVIMDPELTATVPRNQYFYTGMDAFIHCAEALAGQYRNYSGDAYSREVLNLSKEIFLSEDMMSFENRQKLMVASYLGGCSIATSYVGVIHPLSAALSVVLGLHHCIANCIVMRAIEEFYPSAYKDFWSMVDIQRVNIPAKICDGLDDEDFLKLYQATIIHEKPLTNALGEDYKKILTPEKTKQLFKSM